MVLGFERGADVHGWVSSRLRGIVADSSLIRPTRKCWSGTPDSQLLAAILGLRNSESQKSRAKQKQPVENKMSTPFDPDF
jgi:hypothetical protein